VTSDERFWLPSPPVVIHIIHVTTTIRFFFYVYLRHIEHVCINIISYNNTYTFLYAHNAVVHEHDYYSIRILLKWKKIRQRGERLLRVRARGGDPHARISRSIAQYNLLLLLLLFEYWRGGRTKETSVFDGRIWYFFLGGGSNLFWRQRYSGGGWTEPLRL